MQDNIIDSADSVYAENIPNSNSNLVFQLPKNFLNIYRYNGGSEWMMRPSKIKPNKSKIIQFSVRVSPKSISNNLSNYKDLSFSFNEAEKTISKPAKTNLLKYYFQDNNKDKFPDGFSKSSKKNISYKRSKSKKSKTIKIIGSETQSIQLDFSNYQSFDKEKKYLFMVEVKIKNLNFNGHWYKENKGFWTYIYGQHNKHVWSAITGSGKTKGWVTIMLPFDTIGENKNFTKARIFLRLNYAKGTAWLKNPMIVELADNSKLKAHFVLENGNIISSSQLALTKTDK